MEEFLLLCQFFHQDVDVLYPDLSAALHALLSDLTRIQLAHLADFLEISLKNRSDKDLVLLWNECGSDWYIYQDGIRSFLNEVLHKSREYML